MRNHNHNTLCPVIWSHKAPKFGNQKHFFYYYYFSRKNDQNIFTKITVANNIYPKSFDNFQFIKAVLKSKFAVFSHASEIIFITLILKKNQNV